MTDKLSHTFKMDYVQPGPRDSLQIRGTRGNVAGTVVWDAYGDIKKPEQILTAINTDVYPRFRAWVKAVVKQGDAEIAALAVELIAASAVAHNYEGVRRLLVEIQAWSYTLQVAIATLPVIEARDKKLDLF